MATPAGTLQHLLVLANPDAYTPYDPASTALPTEEHVYFTSRRRTNHPWIAQLGDGPGAAPDIDIGGQRLELPLGRATDGECQVRIIDVPSPVTALVCDTAILVPEGNAGMDANAFTTGGWTAHNSVENDPSNVDGVWPPAMDILAGFPAAVEGALFMWIDQPPYPGHPSYPQTVGPWVREMWMERTFDGTEGGGPGFTPGQDVAFRVRANWTLDTGPGNIFAEINGNRVSFPNGSYDFWSIDPSLSSNVITNVMHGVADGSGLVTIKLGAENMAPSFNLQCSFTDLEIVACEPAIVTVDSERYMTGNLADADARQRLLGWPYYLKESVDGGATWTRVVYAGYLKQATMERSLTFLLVGGDAGRGRRVSRAWRGLDPTADFVP